MKNGHPWLNHDPAPVAALPLPPRPGVKRLADVCPHCHVIHGNQASLQACVSLRAQREQL